MILLLLLYIVFIFFMFGKAVGNTIGFKRGVKSATKEIKKLLVQATKELEMNKND